MLNKVDQTIFDTERGDCVSACIATITGVPLNDVPNIHDSPDDDWFDELTSWFESKGYVTDWDTPLSKRNGINGFFIAIVPSKFFNGKKHAVVMNRNGLVVHDPNSKNPWWYLKDICEEIGSDFNSYYPFEQHAKKNPQRKGW